MFFMIALLCMICLVPLTWLMICLCASSSRRDTVLGDYLGEPTASQEDSGGPGTRRSPTNVLLHRKHLEDIFRLGAHTTLDKGSVTNPYSASFVGEDRQTRAS